MIKVGDRVPKGVLKTLTEDGVIDLRTEEIFSGKKVVMFGVPGAFTPGCSRNHMPGYVEAYETIIEKGFDTVACMAVNDAWVMHAWGESRGAIGKLLMLADGSGFFAKSLGIDSDLSAYGMGLRCKRFSMVVNNGIVEQFNVDERAIEFTSAKATCKL